MLTTYNLKMPHAVYGGENAMESIATIIKTLNAKKVREQRNQYFKEQAIEKSIERSREKQLRGEE